MASVLDKFMGAGPPEESPAADSAGAFARRPWIALQRNSATFAAWLEECAESIGFAGFDECCITQV